MPDSFIDIRHGVVLAELGGYGDGFYCAKHGKGASLVLLGTYVVDRGESVPYPEDFVFKPGRDNYAEYLKTHVAEARKSGAKVGVSVISVEIEDSVDFLLAAQEAGADYISLCAVSEMEMFTSRSLGIELCRAENHEILAKWTSAIVNAVDLPFILKVGFAEHEDMSVTLHTARNSGAQAAHININKLNPATGGLALSRLDKNGLFIIAGGGVRDTISAKRVIELGADAVSVAKAAMEDPELCGNIQKDLQHLRQS